MRKVVIVIGMLVLAVGALFMMEQPSVQALEEAEAMVEPVALYQGGDQEGCLTCHDGIENIREEDSGMMVALSAMGECTACHGGDPSVTLAEGDVISDTATVEAAHTPTGRLDEFFPDPGSLWVADQTCGLCHPGYVDALERSLMNTEAGKIQGNLWSWGIQEDQHVIYGNYDVEGAETILGNDTYKEHMTAMKEKFPDQFPESLEMLPNPTVEEIEADPKLAGFTYQRQQCQRCHVAVKGRPKRGDWRGMGCSSCHIPYSNEGLYEGSDQTIDKTESGHMLIHSIQGTREARNGIPTETCNTCHNRGKRIGVSYQGIMEFPYGTPFDENGGKQPKLHTKQYLFIKSDLHHEQESRPENPEGGLLCQDCHTSIDMHGDGNIFGTTLAQVEIECTDCHGTTVEYPWELPIGYGEEFGEDLAEAEARGVGTKDDLEDGGNYATLYDEQDGYLLTSRGNAFGNVVLQTDGTVMVHSATGNDFLVPVLKQLSEDGEWKNQDAQVAMESVGAHMDKMECYACHADWAPQCYGCHVSVNYSVDADGNPLVDTDWVATANQKDSGDKYDNFIKSPGKVSESRSYLRWEEPVLGINGEGRVTPLIPGCQVIFTVRDREGNVLTQNEIGRTPPDVEGAGAEGQRGLDMAPVQPHTAGREARRCESCHGNPKALGYGIDGGRFLQGYDQDRYVDLYNPDGSVMPENAQVQMQAIPDLPMDLSQIVDPETGEQLQTVGSHWPDSGPLTEDQRTRMERTGACMGCHQNMADSAFWTDKVIAKFGTVMSNDEHIDVMNQIIQEAVKDAVEE
ncbi:hypothetical protein QUF64_06590 [Anaerolineales bacterium HSG6]|nr:hypothetical protein [Anaerolineales bacterium HSG6]